MNYIKVTLLVKPGPGAERKITDVLNTWFAECPHEAPFPPGALLHYAIHDETVPGQEEK